MRGKFCHHCFSRSSKGSITVYGCTKCVINLQRVFAVCRSFDLMFGRFQTVICLSVLGLQVKIRKELDDLVGVALSTPFKYGLSCSFTVLLTPAIRRFRVLPL